MPRLIVVHRRDGQPSRSGQMTQPFIIPPRRCLDPLEPAEQTWRFGNFVWVLLNVCVQPQAFLFVASGLQFGLEWEWLIGAAFVTGFIGALFVVLMSDPASKYGISLSVVARSAFGRWGSSIFSGLYLVTCVPWAASYLSIASIGLRTGIISVSPTVASVDPVGLRRNAASKVLGRDQSFLSSLLIVCLALLTWLHFLRNSSVWCTRRLTPLIASIVLSYYIGVGYWAHRSVGVSKSLEAFNEEARRSTTDATPDLVWGLPALIASGLCWWTTLALGLPDLNRYARTRSGYRTALLLMLPLLTCSFAFLLTIANGCLSTLRRSDLPLSPSDLLLPLVPRGFVLPVSILLCLSTIYAILPAYVMPGANAISNLFDSKLNGSASSAILLVIITATAVLSPPLGVLTSSRWALATGLITGGVMGVIVADYYCMRKWRLPTDHLYKARPTLHLCGVNGAAVLALAACYAVFASPWAVHAFTSHLTMATGSSVAATSTLLPLSFVSCFVLSIVAYTLFFRCFNPPAPTQQAPAAVLQHRRTHTARSSASGPNRSTHLQLVMEPSAPDELATSGRHYYDHLYAVTAPLAPTAHADKEETKTAQPRPTYYAHAIPVRD